MPECPEIAVLTHFLSKTKKAVITELDILSDKYKKSKEIKEYIKKINDNNYTITEIDSKGKIMWFKLKDKNTKDILYITSQFGLTGWWSYEANNNNDRIIIKTDKKDLYYNDQLNFGTFNILDKKNYDKKLREIADDVLRTDETFDEFTARVKDLEKKHGSKSILPILMNQKLLYSGIGNYLSVEILYRAKLSPYRTLKSLDKDDLKELYNSIRYVVKLSYYNNKTGYRTHYGDYNDKHKKLIEEGKVPDYLEDVKLKDKEFEFKVYMREKDDKNRDVLADKKINKGRTTYWVPDYQK